MIKAAIQAPHKATYLLLHHHRLHSDRAPRHQVPDTIPYPAALVVLMQTELLLTRLTSARARKVIMRMMEGMIDEDCYAQPTLNPMQVLGRSLRCKGP